MRTRCLDTDRCLTPLGLAYPSAVTDRRRSRTIANRLERAFGPLEPPRASDPLEELIWTVLSQHTSDLNSERAFQYCCARSVAFGGRGGCAAAVMGDFCHVYAAFGVAGYCCNNVEVARNTHDTCKSCMQR